ncbi:UDP-N-acetylglucosamine 1-carboxyvinyltransferase [Aggregatilinea lenta]|uniref:UDP-N-acetylglucosamine 1-carboxyvinyltransferase n=1 Tax=Aggregatilinea lenta TaxID=913108 RepID=UPI0013C3322B|nr:UDP-N-acetylglucosamine 1-carboxyvinyltransferase [Aggregatilinea lenta]
MPEEVYCIEGGKQLEGDVRLSGAKNATLPLLVAACLGEEPSILDNVPLQLNDVQLQIQLLQLMGAKIEISQIHNSVTCCRGQLSGGEAPTLVASGIRTSLLLLGLFAGLGKSVTLPSPGGCNFERKYDLHISGLRKLGASISEDSKSITLSSSGLKGTTVDFYVPTTTGTENIMIGASLAQGTTIIRNANTRPEIQQLGQLLSQMGARVRMQNRIVEVRGVKSLRGGARISVMPGWDEALTYIVGAGITQGSLRILDFDLSNIAEEARYLRQAGIELFEWQGDLYVSGKGKKESFDIFTAPYPGLDTDAQPLFTVLGLVIEGSSVITEMRHANRFQYVEQLRCFGADIGVYGNTAIVQGGKPLVGADVRATDLRGGAALVLCGLAAKGQTRISNIYEIERGYENLPEKLIALGATVIRERSDHDTNSVLQ